MTDEAPYRTGAPKHRKIKPSRVVEDAEPRAAKKRLLTQARFYVDHAHDNLCAAVILVREHGSDELYNAVTADRDFVGHTLAKLDAALAVKGKRKHEATGQPGIIPTPDSAPPARAPGC